MKEKEELLAQVKSRLTFTESSDSAVSSLEESITEKDRQIERSEQFACFCCCCCWEFRVVVCCV